MLDGLTVELKRDNEETQLEMIAHAKVGSKAFGDVRASGECHAVTSTGHVPCSVVCWFS